MRKFISNITIAEILGIIFFIFLMTISIMAYGVIITILGAGIIIIVSGLISLVFVFTGSIKPFKFLDKENK